MQFKLKHIDKHTYQTRSRNAFFLACALLIVTSLASSTLLIAVLSTSDNNFSYNLAGVVIAVVMLVLLASKLRQQPYFAEVDYLWRLKQELNLINRKLPKLNQAAAENQLDAMNALLFSYRASQQVWTLSDNTLLMTEAIKAEQELLEKFAALSLQPAEQYQRAWLDQV